MTRLARSNSASADLSLSVVDGVCSCCADATSSDKKRLNLAKLSIEGAEESAEMFLSALCAALSSLSPTLAPASSSAFALMSSTTVIESGRFWHSCADVVLSTAMAAPVSKEARCPPCSESSLFWSLLAS